MSRPRAMPGAYPCLEILVEALAVAVTRKTLAALAQPVNQGDFEAFVRAVEQLPESDRNVLAVLGAGELLQEVGGERLSQHGVLGLMGWMEQFRQRNTEAP